MPIWTLTCVAQLLTAATGLCPDSWNSLGLKPRAWVAAPQARPGCLALIPAPSKLDDPRHAPVPICALGWCLVTPGVRTHALLHHCSSSVKTLPCPLWSHGPSAMLAGDADTVQCLHKGAMQGISREGQVGGVLGGSEAQGGHPGGGDARAES